MGGDKEKRGIGNPVPVKDGGRGRAVEVKLSEPITMPDGRLVTGYLHIQKPDPDEVPDALDAHPGKTGKTGPRIPGDYDSGF